MTGHIATPGTPAEAPPGHDAASLDTPGLDDWVATQRRMLTNFVGAVQEAPLDALTLALRQACGNGFGDWLIPETASPRHPRPATHLVEIHVLGVHGTGLTVEEAARNWRRAALAMLQAEDGVTAQPHGGLA
jgi:hypothetical protein